MEIRTLAVSYDYQRLYCGQLRLMFSLFGYLWEIISSFDFVLEYGRISAAFNYMNPTWLTIYYWKRVGYEIPSVVVYLRHLHHHSTWVGRVQWARKWTDSGCHRRPYYADVRAHCKNQCKEDTCVCPLTRDITLHTLHYCLPSGRDHGLTQTNKTKTGHLKWPF